FNRILQRKTPLIFLNKKVDSPNAHLIVNDKGAAIYKACSHLIKAGHEDIALLLEEENCPNSKVVMTGYKKAFLENGLEFKEELIINHNNHNQNYLETAIKKSFSLSKPTAFLTSNNQLTITLIKTLSEL